MGPFLGGAVETTHIWQMARGRFEELEGKCFQRGARGPVLRCCDGDVAHCLLVEQCEEIQEPDSTGLTRLLLRK
ncbi:unnamed protein product [Caretta caretta]